MTVYVISRKSYDYYEFTDIYGVVTNPEDAQKTLDILPDISVARSKEEHARLSESDTEHWYIEGFICDIPDVDRLDRTISKETETNKLRERFENQKKAAEIVAETSTPLKKDMWTWYNTL